MTDASGPRVIEGYEEYDDGDWIIERHEGVLHVTPPPSTRPERDNVSQPHEANSLVAKGTGRPTDQGGARHWIR